MICYRHKFQCMKTILADCQTSLKLWVKGMAPHSLMENAFWTHDLQNSVMKLALCVRACVRASVRASVRPSMVDFSCNWLIRFF